MHISQRSETLIKFASNSDILLSCKYKYTHCRCVIISCLPFPVLFRRVPYKSQCLWCSKKLYIEHIYTHYTQLRSREDWKSYRSRNISSLWITTLACTGTQHTHINSQTLAQMALIQLLFIFLAKAHQLQLHMSRREIRNVAHRSSNYTITLFSQLINTSSLSAQKTVCALEI